METRQGARFFSDEDGAVTVDWVVLTAALVALGIPVVTIVAGGLNSATNSIDVELENAAAYSPGFGSWTRSGAGGSQAEETPPGG